MNRYSYKGVSRKEDLKYQPARGRASNVYQSIGIPSFSLGPFPWPGASIILAEVSFSTSSACSLLLPLSIQEDSFCLALRDSSGRRYKLQNNVGELLLYPTYKCELLPAGTYTIEIWSVQGHQTATSEGVTISTSLVIEQDTSSSNCSIVTAETLGSITTKLFGDYSFPYIFSQDY